MARSSECTEQYAQKVFDRDPHCQRRDVTLTTQMRLQMTPAKEGPHVPEVMGIYRQPAAHAAGSPVLFLVDSVVPTAWNDRMREGASSLWPAERWARICASALNWTTTASSRSWVAGWVWSTRRKTSRRLEIPSRRTRQRCTSPQPFPAGGQSCILPEPPEHLHDL